MTLPPLPPWNLVQPKLLWLALPALLVAAVVTLIFRLGRNGTRQTLGAAVGLAAGLVAGNVGAGVPWNPEIARQPLLDWWSSSGWSALFPAALAGLAGGALAAVSQSRSPLLALVLRLATIAGCCSWLVSGEDRVLRAWLTAGGIPEGRLPTDDSGGLYWQTWLVLFLIILIDWEALRRVWLAPRSTGALLEPLSASECGGAAGLALLWSLPASTVIILSHSARLADVALLWTAALLGLGLGIFVAGIGQRLLSKRGSSLSVTNSIPEPAWLAGPAISLPALLLVAGQNSYSQVPVGAYLLAALAPWGIWLLAIPALKRLPPLPRSFMTALLLALPTLAAIAWTLRYETFDFGENW